MTFNSFAHSISPVSKQEDKYHSHTSTLARSSVVVVLCQPARSNRGGFVVMRSLPSRSIRCPTSLLGARALTRQKHPAAPTGTGSGAMVCITDTAVFRRGSSVWYLPRSACSSSAFQHLQMEPSISSITSRDRAATTPARTLRFNRGVH